LEVIDNDRLIDNSNKVGTYLREKLKGLMNKFSIIGDVRGVGLSIGILIIS
jgi:4-aminobutyrate aminotransferase-like enzyme